MEDMARNEIIKDVYVQTFEKGLEKDMDSSYYKKVSDLIGEDNIQLAIASVFDNAVRPSSPSTTSTPRAVSNWCVCVWSVCAVCAVCAVCVVCVVCVVCGLVSPSLWVLGTSRRTC
jgi:hypothetical protein